MCVYVCAHKSQYVNVLYLSSVNRTFSRGAAHGSFVNWFISMPVFSHGLVGENHQKSSSHCEAATHEKPCAVNTHLCLICWPLFLIFFIVVSCCLPSPNLPWISPATFPGMVWAVTEAVAVMSKSFPCSLIGRPLFPSRLWGSPQHDCAPLHCLHNSSLCCQVLLVTLPCFPHQGHREALGAQRRWNVTPFYAPSQSLSPIHACRVKYYGGALLNSHRPIRAVCERCQMSQCGTVFIFNSVTFDTASKRPGSQQGVFDNTL